MVCVSLLVTSQFAGASSSHCLGILNSVCLIAGFNIFNLNITVLTVLLAGHIGVLVPLTARAEDARELLLIISWKLFILLFMDFTWFGWMVVLYHSMERTFFAGDGSVMVEGSLGMVNWAVAV